MHGAAVIGITVVWQLYRRGRGDSRKGKDEAGSAYRKGGRGGGSGGDGRYNWRTGREDDDERQRSSMHNMARAEHMAAHMSAAGYGGGSGQGGRPYGRDGGFMGRGYDHEDSD